MPRGRSSIAARYNGLFVQGSLPFALLIRVSTRLLELPLCGVGAGPGVHRGGLGLVGSARQTLGCPLEPGELPPPLRDTSSLLGRLTLRRLSGGRVLLGVRALGRG